MLAVATGTTISCSMCRQHVQAAYAGSMCRQHGPVLSLSFFGLSLGTAKKGLGSSPTPGAGAIELFTDVIYVIS
jgi:hypothetical protein